MVINMEYNSSKGVAMKQVVSKSKFKPQALEYFRQVEESGEPLIITDRGKPVLKILPYSKHPVKGLAALRGSVVKYERPLEPVGEGDWEVHK
jgi:prevent-host-death family protein